MVLQIDLSAETESRLREQATAAGKDLTTYAREALEEAAALGPDPGDRPAGLSKEQWVSKWLAWTASFPLLGQVADDSRESIYEGRGE